MLRLARSGWGGWLIGIMLEYFSFALPVRRLHETAHLLAFHHPRPAYPFHVLIVPKKRIRSLSEADPALPFMSELWAAVQYLVQEFHLELCGYRVIVNGGQYQDVPQLHVHLISQDYEHKNPTSNE